MLLQGEAIQDLGRVVHSALLLAAIHSRGRAGCRRERRCQDAFHSL